MRRPSIAVAATTLTALALGACSTGRETLTGSGLAAGGILAAGGLLQRFDACEPLLDHLKAEALERVGPWGLDGGDQRWLFMEDDVAMAADGDTGGAATGDAAPRSAPVAGEDYSTTNVQEAGVDEPDIVKTDGEIVVSVSEGTLHVVDATASQPRELASVDLPEEWGWGAQLLMVGDRVVVFGSRWGGVRPMPLIEPGIAADAMFAPQFDTPVTSAWLLNLSDPSSPQREAELELDGSVLSARQVGDRVHLAVTAQPTGLAFVFPDGGLRGEREAEERNRQVIEDSSIEDWLPWAVHVDDRGIVDEGTALDCADVAAPIDFAGFGTVALVSLDPATGDLEPASAAGVVSNGETVYASTDRFVVATSRWIEPEVVNDADRVAALDEDWVTALHAFDITDPADVQHVASGTVPGTLLNQFSMSEYDGVLRVASTRGTPWSGGSDSLVTTLGEQDGSLVTLGQVGGLGRGERIFAVRFLGDVGYVVTFRQVDPLYTIDLADPTDPTVRGELKIPGYSAYLHPLEDGYLLGVGQDATDEGFTTGTQLQVFDVTDLADPQRTAQLTLVDGYSDAEWDHHAFLHWPSTGLTVLPLTIWGADVMFDDDVDRLDEDPNDDGVVVEVDPDTGEIVEIRPVTEPPATSTMPVPTDMFVGAMAFHVDAEDGIDRIGRITHTELTGQRDPWRGQIVRSMIIDGDLWTMSAAGLVISDADTLETLATVAF